MKKLNLFLLFLIIIGGIYAFTGIVNTFTNGLTQENITLVGDVPTYRYVDIPKTYNINSSLTINSYGTDSELTSNFGNVCTPDTDAYYIIDAALNYSINKTLIDAEHDDMLFTTSQIPNIEWDAITCGGSASTHGYNYSMDGVDRGGEINKYKYARIYLTTADAQCDDLIMYTNVSKQYEYGTWEIKLWINTTPGGTFGCNSALDQARIIFGEGTSYDWSVGWLTNGTNESCNDLILNSDVLGNMRFQNKALYGWNNLSVIYNQTGSYFYGNYQELLFNSSLLNVAYENTMNGSNRPRFGMEYEANNDVRGRFYYRDLLYYPNGIEGGCPTGLNLSIDLFNDTNIEYNAFDSFKNKNIILNATYINDKINSCDCPGCTNFAGVCRSPINILSTTSGILEIKNLNFTYIFGLDNCSNSFGIPDNGTSLNVSFFDSTNLNPSIVNVTLDIEGYVNYSTTYLDISKFDICIYPSYANYTENVDIVYSQYGVYNTYNYNTRLTNVTQHLSLYTQSGTSRVTFSVTDKDTGENLQDVTASMLRKINGEFQVIESKLTDITGNAQFNYEPNVEYKFYFSKSNYAEYIFTLNPVLYSSYDVKMIKSVTLNDTVDYDRVALIYSPTIFYNGDNNFTFLIASPYNELISYGYDLTYPGGKTGKSASNSMGSQLMSTFTIVGANSYDRLRLDYYYDTELTGLRNFTFYYTISVPASNYTLISNRDETYGLGIFERILIGVGIVILVVGIGTLIGQPIMSMGLGLIVLGYLTYIGLVPIWASFMSMALGVILLGMKEGE